MENESITVSMSGRRPNQRGRFRCLRIDDLSFFPILLLLDVFRHERNEFKIRPVGFERNERVPSPLTWESGVFSPWNHSEAELGRVSLDGGFEVWHKNDNMVEDWEERVRELFARRRSSTRGSAFRRHGRGWRQNRRESWTRCSCQKAEELSQSQVDHFF